MAYHVKPHSAGRPFASASQSTPEAALTPASAPTTVLHWNSNRRRLASRQSTSALPDSSSAKRVWRAHIQAYERSQPSKSISSTKLARCARSVGTKWPGVASPYAPIVFTYATFVNAEQWLLGLSAALHGWPVALAGFGRENFQWWKPGTKLPGTVRAAELLGKLAPNRTIMFGDGGDTVIANPFTSTTRAVLAELHNTPRVLISSECNSWPVCYRDMYTEDIESVACSARSATCYPNSGAFIGRPGPMVQFLRGLQRMTPWSEREARERNMSVAEIANDQAGMHRLFINRSAEPFVQSVDALSAFFLNLFPCTGPSKEERLHSQSRFDPYRMCHEREYEPLPDIHVLKDGLEFVNSEGTIQRPVLVHANGLHYRMTSNRTRTPFSYLIRSLRAQRAKLLEYPILLIDSAFDGTCSVSKLGDVLARSREMLNDTFWRTHGRTVWVRGQEPT